MVAAMMQHRPKPIVFRCPATGIDVISSMRVDPAALCCLPDQPLMLSCFCGDTHAIHLKRFVSKKSSVRRAVNVAAR